MGTTLIFIALIFFACIAWVRRDLALGTLLFALPSYLMRFALGPIPTTLLEGMILVLFATWFGRDCVGLRGFASRMKERWAGAVRAEQALYISLAIFVFFATVSVFVSPVLRGALGVWRAYFIEPALVFIIFLDVVRSKEQFRGMLHACIASGVLIALFAVYQKFTGWHIPAPWLIERRATSLYEYPNAVGLYLAPIVFFALGRFGEIVHDAKSMWMKSGAVAVKGASTVLLVSAVVCAKTGGALVGISSSLIAVALCWSRRSRISLVCVGVVIGVILFSHPAQFALIKEKLTFHAWSGQVRKVMWTETVAMIHDRPILGAGLAGYQSVFAPYHKANYIEIFLYPHSIVLNFWSEMGIGGLTSFFAIVACYFFLLFSALKASRSRAPEERFFIRLYVTMFAAAMSTILIHGLVDVPYFKNDLSVFFWMLLACAVFLHQFAAAKEMDARA